MAHEFVRAGHDVEFVLMQARGELLDEAKASFPVVDLAAPRARRLPFVLASHLRRSRPNALLAAMWPLTVIAPFAQRLSGHRCKVLISEHGMLSAQYGDWGRLHRVLLRLSTGIGYRMADHRVGVSSGLVQDMADLARMNDANFNVIYNPVPRRTTPSADMMRTAEAFWACPQGNRILAVGNLKAVKNHPLLLRAFAKVSRPDARLMILGDGTGKSGLMSLAAELGISDRVILAGFHRDPSPFYATADLFALSSDYEGFGNVIVEALSFGLPVVSTDCPAGPAEILDKGKHGRLVPVQDVEALARAMDAGLEAPVDRDALRRRAADFAPEIAARKYLDLLGLT